MSKSMELKDKVAAILLKPWKVLLGRSRRQRIRAALKKHRSVLVDIRGNDVLHVYNDDLAFLESLGGRKIARVGYVEPYVHLGHILWSVDLAGVGGPLEKGFYSQASALRYELKWVNENMDTIRQCLRSTN